MLAWFELAVVLLLLLLLFGLMEVGDGGFSVVFVEELSASKEREREKDRECENEKRVRGRPLEESERGGERLKLC